jgi:hypothetical protein
MPTPKTIILLDQLGFVIPCANQHDLPTANGGTEENIKRAHSELRNAVMIAVRTATELSKPLESVEIHLPQVMNAACWQRWINREIELQHCYRALRLEFEREIKIFHLNIEGRLRNNDSGTLDLRTVRIFFTLHIRRNRCIRTSHGMPSQRCRARY